MARHALTPVDYKHDCVCVRVIASPVWSNRSLAAEIPDLKFDVLVLENFDIETNGWDSLDRFVCLILCATREHMKTSWITKDLSHRHRGPTPMMVPPSP
jgi:hypothetical protein